MSFDFLGIFTKQDLESLRSCLQGEVDKIDAQVNHMIMEANKLQKTLNALIQYSNTKGIKFKTFEKTFYRQTRSQYDDTNSAILVQRIKEPFYANLKDREKYEYRMRKLIDKIEQMHERIHILRIMKSEFRLNIESTNALFNSLNPQLTVESEVI